MIVEIRETRSCDKASKLSLVYNYIYNSFFDSHNCATILGQIRLALKLV